MHVINHLCIIDVYAINSSISKILVSLPDSKYGNGSKLHKVTKLHEGTFHKDKVAQGTKLHDDNIPPRVNFVRVAILHGGSFLHDGKRTEKKKKKTKKSQCIPFIISTLMFL